MPLNIWSQFNIWTQTLCVFVALMIFLGYFQYRRTRDIIEVAQELFRPAYLMPAAIGAVAYLIIKVVVNLLSAVL